MSILSFKLDDLRRISVKDFGKRLYNKALVEEDLLSSAAQVAFYFAFALFPLLLFLVTLFGIVLESANDLRTEMFFYLRQVMPGSASDLVQQTIDQVTQNSSGGKLTFGAAIALYSASAGIDSIRVALNGVYNLTETRPWWKTKLLSLTLTLVLAVLITIALGVIFYGGKFLNLILGYISLPIQSPFFLGVLTTVTVLIVLISTFALLYNYLPKHRKSSWVWITPGAFIGIVLWIALSYAFRLYLDYFNSYDKTYGSLGAMIILMLWLYLTALVILIGGSINAVLTEFTDPETAAAAKKKAAAQQVVQSPDGKVAPKNTTDSLDKAHSTDSSKARTPAKTKSSGAEVNGAETEDTGKKSKLGFVFRTIFKIGAGIFYLRKKR